MLSSSWWGSLLPWRRHSQVIARSKLVGVRNRQIVKAKHLNMASCLVPDFPAVMVSLEHLKELDKQLKEEGVSFSPEASLHLTEITAAITKLEADRRAAHEHLEVETIENSKLRHQINSIRERMSQEIIADVAAARASNAEEIDQLHKELSTVCQLQEATLKKQEALFDQNKALIPEREQVKAEHKEVIAALNDLIAEKYRHQVQLDQTQERIEELKSCAAAVKQDPQNMVLDRQVFGLKKDGLSREVDETESKIKQQKQAISRSRRELDRLTDKKQEIHKHLGKLMIHITKLESNAETLTASRCQCEKQLEEETQKHQEFRQQKETLKRELCELKGSFSNALQCLKEEIAAVEREIEEGRASRFVCQDSLAQIYEIFNRQRNEENEVRAEHFHVSQQLERSKLQLEERIASIVKYSNEIKEMDKQINELLEAGTINKRVFERNQEEMCDNMDTVKKNISHLEEEKKHLVRLLEEAKRTQEEHVVTVTSNITNTRRRHQELQQEEVALQLRQPKSVDAELLMSHVTQCEAEFRQKETKLLQEIEWCAAETERITKSNEEKQKEMEQKEEMLKEVEAKWEEEQDRHQRLKTLTSELRRQRSDLELSIPKLKEETSSLLQAKEQMKAKLEEMHVSRIDTLDKQASELRAVEVSIYNHGVEQQQVSIENNRLRLSITQMTEDIGRAREDKERYWQDIQQFKQDIEALREHLQEAWREDLSVTQDHRSSSGVLLESINAMLECLKTRRQQLGNVNTLLHQLMLDFSKRLGDKAIIEQN